MSLGSVAWQVVPRCGPAALKLGRHQRILRGERPGSAREAVWRWSAIAAGSRPGQPLRMRRATLVAILLLVGCIDDAPTADDQLIAGRDEPDGGDVIVGVKPTHGPDDCPGGDGGGHGMDPEPDRNKDRNSCHDWCGWSRRQCDKWCWKEYPEPFRDWYKRNRCFRDRCEEHQNPNIGRKACEADCNRRFPERPLTATETTP